jgi:probable F420-dependent oxidoreductase
MNYGTCADPAAAARVARTAEAAGFESLWTAEHVVLPLPRPDGFPIAPDLPWLASIPALTLLATATDTIRIASGTIELPMHPPVRLAKQLASIDVIANGRLIVGFGAGYLREEFDATGVSLAERGLRMDEHLDALVELWTGDPPEYSGRTVSFSGIDAHPRPLQPGGPRIIFGGGTTAVARRRIITRGNGWYLFGTDVESTAEAIRLIEREAERWERPPDLGPIEVTVTPTEPLDRSTFGRYEELGVHRLVLLPRQGAPPGERHVSVPEPEILRTIDRAANLI